MWSAARPSWHGPGNSGADNTELLFPILQKQVQWNLRPGIAVGPKGSESGKKGSETARRAGGRGAARVGWGLCARPPAEAGAKVTTSLEKQNKVWIRDEHLLIT